MKIVVARHVEYICLNDYEFLLNDDQEMLEFDTVEDAKQYLFDKGLKEADLEGIYFGIICEECRRFVEWSDEIAWIPATNSYICPDCHAKLTLEAK